ncbi:MAG: peptidylprolyl isomerase [Gammaproteobacteria bacterium]|nr:peptidylprolyl isomerase [Gammaproteobacteria bacterium]
MTRKDALPKLPVLLVLITIGASLLPAAFASAAAANDVVIELDDVSITRDALDERFAVALQLLAMRQGISLAGQDPAAIENLRQQYLDKYASELVLLREAQRRQIELPDAVIDAELAGLFESEPDEAAFLESLPMSPARGRDRLRRIITDEKTIELLTEHMIKDIKIAPGDVITLHHDIKDTLATPEQVCVRHIQTESLAEANAVIDELRSGAEFGELAKSRSTDDASAALGGDLGCFERGHGGTRSEFERAAFAATEGELSGPVESHLGFHALIVYEHKMPRAPTLNEAYAQIERELAMEKLPQQIQAIVSNSGIRVYAENYQSTADDM